MKRLKKSVPQKLTPIQGTNDYWNYSKHLKKSNSPKTSQKPKAAPYRKAQSE